MFSRYILIQYIFMGLRDTIESQSQGELFQGKTYQVSMEMFLFKEAITKWSFLSLGSTSDGNK